MGVSDQNENEYAHKLVQKDKTEEDMFEINFLFFEFNIFIFVLNKGHMEQIFQLGRFKKINNLKCFFHFGTLLVNK